MPNRRTVVILLLAALFSVMALTGSVSAAGNDGFTFVIFSDCHVPTYLFPLKMPLDDATLLPMHNQQRLQEFTAECLSMNPRPEFVMNNGDTGDLGWTPLLAMYQKLMQPLLAQKIPVYTVVGNHDLDYTGITRLDLAEYYDPLGPALIGRHGTRYSFDYGGCHIAVMNNRPISGLLRFNPTDIDWLRNDLKKVKKDTRVFVFMHANMTGVDTNNIVEILQGHKNAIIFQGHKHSDGIERWGGIPVVLTGSLYGGTPEAGSYRVVNVTPDKVTLKTRDFAKPKGTFNPEIVVDLPIDGPQLTILEPKNNAFTEGTVQLSARIKPVVAGSLEYRFDSAGKWTPVSGSGGTWEARIDAPAAPGHHLLEVQFKGDNGAVIWAHSVVKVTGGGVKEVWATDIKSAVQGAPVLWQDRVIVPTMERGVFALRLSDGKQVWRRDLDKDQVVGRIVIDGDVVYFGAGRAVYACQAKNGKILWKTPVKGTIVADITYDNGKLFVPSGEHALVCLDAAQGAILWEHAVKYPIIMAPVADANTVYIGAMDGYCRAVDASTGLERWNRQLSSMDDIYTSTPYWPPESIGNMVFATKRPTETNPNNLIALSKTDGSTVWSCPLSGWPSRIVAARDKASFYTIYSESGKKGLQRLSVKDGSVIWKTAGPVAMYAGVLAGNDIVIRDDMNVGCADAASGTMKWTYRASVGPQGSLFGPCAFVVKDRTAYVATMDGEVFALTW